MSKVTLALGSFAVGLVLGALFLGSQTVTFAHPLSATQIHAEGNGVAFVLHKEPNVPGLGPKLPDGTSVKGGKQPLDGFDCTGCRFEDATLLYSGGSVRLDKTTFAGTLRVELTGAAANTVALLPLLQAISAGHAPEPVNPNRPAIKTASAKTPLTNVNWTAPY